MKNLKITARLLDGRVNSNDGIFNLDSILAYAWMLENHPDDLQNNNLRPDNVIEPDLPLAKDEDGRWKASLGFYEQHAEIVEYWHKKVNDFDAAYYVDFQGKRGKINGASGEYKAYRMPQIIRVVSDIEFYAVGDPDEIRRLLGYVTNIGKKASQGYGYVREWAIEEIEDDYTDIGPYGIMRTRPFTGELPNDGQAYQIKKVRLKPPYHLHIDRVPCIIPNVRRDQLA